MKNNLLILIIFGAALFVSASGQTGDSRKDSILEDAKYDKFTDLTTLDVSLGQKKYGSGVMESIYIHANAEVQGKLPITGSLKRVSFKLTFINYFGDKGSRINGADSVILLAGTERFQLVGEYPPAPGPLIVELPLDSKAIKALRTSKGAELKIGDVVIDLAEHYLRDFNALIEVASPTASSAESKSKTPLVAKRVSSILEVTSDMPSFVDVPVKLNANVYLSNDYYFGYDKARESHLAFKISDATTRSAWLFMVRGDKASELRQQLIQKGLKEGLYASVTFVIKKDRYNPDASYLSAEFLDISEPDDIPWDSQDKGDDQDKEPIKPKSKSKQRRR